MMNKATMKVIQALVGFAGAIVFGSMIVKEPLTAKSILASFQPPLLMNNLICGLVFAAILAAVDLTRGGVPAFYEQISFLPPPPDNQSLKRRALPDNVAALIAFVLTIPIVVFFTLPKFGSNAYVSEADMAVALAVPAVAFGVMTLVMSMLLANFFNRR